MKLKSIYLSIFFISFLFQISAKVRFVRVVFNSDASNSCSIIWDQNSGDFKSLMLWKEEFRDGSQWVECDIADS